VDSFPLSKVHRPVFGSEEDGIGDSLDKLNEGGSGVARASPRRITEDGGKATNQLYSGMAHGKLAFAGNERRPVADDLVKVSYHLVGLSLVLNLDVRQVEARQIDCTKHSLEATVISAEAEIPKELEGILELIENCPAVIRLATKPALCDGSHPIPICPKAGQIRRRGAHPMDGSSRPFHAGAFDLSGCLAVTPISSDA
jgi:hypothetical protein